MNEIFHPIKILIITEKGREEYWVKKFIQIFKKINIKKQRNMYIQYRSQIVFQVSLHLFLEFWF